MKKFFTISTAMMLAAAAAFASPAAEADYATMNAADTQALFGESNVDVVALNQSEMITTEGKGSVIIPSTMPYTYQRVYVISSKGRGGWRYIKVYGYY